MNDVFLELPSSGTLILLSKDWKSKFFKSLWEQGNQKALNIIAILD